MIDIIPKCLKDQPALITGGLVVTVDMSGKGLPARDRGTE